MNDLIKIKGGKGNVPVLQDKELGYSRDEKALYIGTPKGNEKLCSADGAKKITEHEEKIDELVQKINACLDKLETLKEYVDGNIENINARLDALETSGE